MAFSGKASGDQIKGRPRAAFFDAALVRNQDFYGRAAPAVAVAFRDAAGRSADPQIHLRFENDPIARFGEGTLDADAAIWLDLRIHKEIDGMDDRPCPS